MKKIGILAFVNENSGGVHQYTQSLVDALAKDYTHKYIIFFDQYSGDINTYDLEVRKVKAFKPSAILKILKSFQLILLRRTSSLEKIDKSIYSDIDLFICPRVIMYTQFFSDKPFILTIHDLQERYFPEYFSIQERIIRYVTTRFLSKTSEKIICESNYVKNDIMKYLKIKDEKIHVLPAPPPLNFLNIKIDNEREKEIKQKYKLPDNFIFYPAAFWAHKNHIKLIEAFKLMLTSRPNLYLVLSGSGKRNLNNVLNKINELGVTQNVLLLGYVEYEDLPYIYVLSKMLVMPSLFESISIPIFEAFALKVPVCASNILAIPEQVGNAGLLFNPNDERDIANKINDILKDENLCNEISLKGYKRLKEYSHTEYKNMLARLF